MLIVNHQYFVRGKNQFATDRGYDFIFHAGVVTVTEQVVIFRFSENLCVIISLNMNIQLVSLFKKMVHIIQRDCF